MEWTILFMLLDDFVCFWSFHFVFQCFKMRWFDTFAQVHLKIAPATETLQKLVDNNEAGTFDFAFIDADKVEQWGQQ